ncbi:MAG: RtcB family protein, partial [Candidatus Bilamarchaeaceae archaeon]
MQLKKIDKAIWKMEQDKDMRVPAFIFANDNIIDGVKKDRTLDQLKNVAGLPGIIKHALLMPDGHEGYGFPIGGVAAFGAVDGIVSPGGVGYDINCGVRLLTTPLHREEVKPKIRQICDTLFKDVPSGVGSEGRIKLSHEELDEAAVLGVDWALEKGYGTKEDKEHCEEYGRIEGADPKKVSPTAKKRGKSQFGTLGAGNHFLEIQVVEKIYLPEVAKAFGLEEGKVTVMIHCGSRGYGHQICSDSIPPILNLARKKNLWLPDPELAYASLDIEEAQNYLAAMRCAVNYAFTNRHIIAHWTR